MKINFKDKEIELKYSIRAMMIYENITESAFAPKTISDILTFFYCIVVTSSKDYSIEFEDFIDYVDEHSDVITEFSSWMQSVITGNDKLKKG